MGRFWIALWKKKNSLLSIIAVIGIVYTAVWFYGADNAHRVTVKQAAADMREIHQVNKEASVRQDKSVEEDKDKDNQEQQAAPDRNESVVTSVPVAVEDIQPTPSPKTQEVPSLEQQAIPTPMMKPDVQTNAPPDIQSKEADKSQSKDQVKDQLDLSLNASPKEPIGSPLPPVPTNEPASPASSPHILFTIIGPPDVGTIVETREVPIGDSDTVLDILKRVTRELKIHMEFKGTGASAYIEGINNLYEFDNGPGSGWMYSVNRKFPNRSAGIWKVQSGDHVQWHYTEDLGKDLGAGMKDGLWEGNR